MSSEAGACPPPRVKADALGATPVLDPACATPVEHACGPARVPERQRAPLQRAEFWRAAWCDYTTADVKTLSVSGSQPIQSLGRVLDVLGVFDAERSELSLSEIAELLGWPLPTTARTAATLVERDYLARDPHTKLFSLGSEIVRLAASLIAGFRLPELARPHLQTLSEETGETASLAVLDGRDVLFLASSPGQFRMRVQSSPGLRSRAHCTALGKCLLAQLDPDDARALLGPEPYPRETSKSARTWKQLAPRLTTVRAEGYSLSVGEYEDGLAACAVAVSTRDRLVAAINVAGPVTRSSPDTLVKVVVPKLQAAAGAIGRAQGYP